ncbi:ubiquitin protein ligase sneaky isoform X1 [Musca autumnalis]|uniref:ubiquitin protein ligase sneaky isoform X1 n=1 Tax=Musca autumnalis TaxID=221902 RepID=UPI003CF95A4C
MGAFCAYLLCQLIFKSFIFPKKYEKLLLTLMILFVSCGFVFTDSVKCVVYLIFIALMGKSGRGYLRALCFAFVIAGPIENLSTNAGEIVRVYGCSKILALNLTRTRFDLMTKPFQNTLVHMKDDIREVQKTFSEFQNVTKAIHQEVLEDDPPPEELEFNSTISKRNTNTTTDNLSPEYIEEKYKNKFRKRCELQLESGKARCRKAFANSLEKCREKMPIILRTLICWPFKVDFICRINILGNPEKICDPSPAIADDFGQSYVKLLNNERQLYKDNSEVKVHYAISSPESMPEFQSAKETAKSVAKEFNMRKQVFDSILKMLEQVLAFMLFRILLACISYHNNYYKHIDHDNIYITEYFKRIDYERKQKGKVYLLPLKKYEKTKLIDVDNVWQRTVEESRAVAYHLMQFALEIIAALFFLFLDYVIVTVLLVIRKNSQITFVQEGEHSIHFAIKGSGLIARLLRTTMRNFNMHERVSTFLTNEPCLPKPNVLPRSFYLKLLGLYILVILLIYQSATFLRMRRLICGYFYRKQEKRRILYLYNCLLRQRRSAKETMVKQAKLNFANRKIRLKANILLKLRLRWPDYFHWLQRFNAGRRKCVICEGFEDNNFVICNNVNCGVSYCDACWQDMENVCLVCSEILSVEVVLNFSDFYEEFSFV